MSLLEDWRKAAYGTEKSQNEQNAFWKSYFSKEKDFYAELLSSDEEVKGTVGELAEKYHVDTLLMTGILDGINDSLKEKNPLETMDGTTVLSLDYDRESLYKNMVLAKADWLYGLSEWDRHITEERRKELYRIAKQSNTVVKGKKIGRNDPCPCGSGRKYKQCHGKNA